MAANAFSLAPALANGGVIDYSTSEGIKIYGAATSSLVEDPLFDCDSEGLSHFLGKVGIRAQTNGWNGSIFAVPVDIADPLGDTHDFLTNYGVMSLSHIREHALTYVGTQSRAAQDSMQLGIAIMKSVSVAGFNKLTIRAEDYTVLDLISGVALLKIVIGVSHIDTHATTSFIRGELSSLDLYVPKIRFDIGVLNNHIRTLMKSLRARGETTYDLLSFLFKALEAVPDPEFKVWVTAKKSEYEEGRRMVDGELLTAESLMVLAENKYKGLVQLKKWTIPTVEDDKLVALEAEVSKLQSALKVGAREHEDRAKGQPRKKKERTDKPIWMTTKPGTGDPQKIVKDGKDYWWCSNHLSFGRHQPSECQGKGVFDKKKPGGATRETKFASAMEAYIDEDGEDME
jgi:hypothetical protein